MDTGINAWEWELLCRHLPKEAEALDQDGYLDWLATRKIEAKNAARVEETCETERNGLPA
jgi:hypothetical protein